MQRKGNRSYMSEGYTPPTTPYSLKNRIFAEVSANNQSYLNKSSILIFLVLFTSLILGVWITHATSNKPVPHLDSSYYITNYQRNVNDGFYYYDRGSHLMAIRHFRIAKNLFEGMDANYGMTLSLVAICQSEGRNCALADDYYNTMMASSAFREEKDKYEFLQKVKEEGYAPSYSYTGAR